MSSKSIEAVPVLFEPKKEESILKKIDQIIDLSFLGIDEEEDFLETDCINNFGISPHMWKNADCSRRVGYSCYFAKMLLELYISMPEIPEEAKLGIQSDKVDSISTYGEFYAGYNTAACLNKLLLAYVDSLHMWKRSSYRVVTGDWNSEAEGWEKIVDCFPEWLRPMYQNNTEDFSVIAISMIADFCSVAEDAVLEVWESRELYDLYIKAFEAEEDEICSILCRLEYLIFRQNQSTESLCGCYLAHERKTLVICSFTGYEMVGDGVYVDCMMIPQRYPYNYASVEILGKLATAVKKMK